MGGLFTRTLKWAINTLHDELKFISVSIITPRPPPLRLFLNSSNFLRAFSVLDTANHTNNHTLVIFAALATTLCMYSPYIKFIFWIPRIKVHLSCHHRRSLHQHFSHVLSFSEEATPRNHNAYNLLHKYLHFLNLIPTFPRQLRCPSKIPNPIRILLFFFFSPSLQRTSFELHCWHLRLPLCQKNRKCIQVILLSTITQETAQGRKVSYIHFLFSTHGAHNLQMGFCFSM